MKITKKLTALLLGIILVISLTACTQKEETTEATKFMDEFISTFRAGEFETASAMTQDPAFIFFQVAEDPTFTVASQEAAITMMKELEYSYLSETVTDDITTLEIEFNVKNVGELFTAGMRSAVLKNLETSEAGLSDEEIVTQVGQAFEEAFNAKPTLHKETVTVELKKTDTSYTIVPTGELLNMLMGNLLRAQQEITQALSGVTAE